MFLCIKNATKSLIESNCLLRIKIISIILNKPSTMMRLIIIATCILFKIFLPNFAFASNLNPEKILDSVDDLYRSNTSYGILALSVTTKNWQRTLTLEQWSKGEDRHLI